MSKTEPMCFEIPFGTRIEAVCARKNTRYAINGVCCDGANKRLCATDGRALVVLPIPDMPDGQCNATIPVDALEAFNPDNDERATHVKVTVEETTVHFPNGKREIHPNIEGNFPKVDDVLDWKSPCDLHVAFDADYLGRIAAAFGTSTVQIGIRLEDGRQTGPLLVAPCVEDDTAAPDARACFMPIQMGGTRLPALRKADTDRKEVPHDVTGKDRSP